MIGVVNNQSPKLLSDPQCHISSSLMSSTSEAVISESACRVEYVPNRRHVTHSAQGCLEDAQSARALLGGQPKSVDLEFACQSRQTFPDPKYEGHPLGFYEAEPPPGQIIRISN